MKQYVYTADTLPELKKYGIARILFLLLGCLVLLLQSLSWLVVWLKDMEITVSDMAFVGITLVASLSFVMSQSVWAIRNKKIIKAIKNNGSFTTKRLNVRVSDKSSFAGALVLLCRIIAIVCVILLGILIVSFIQNYLNWGRIILKMPLMVYLTIGFLNVSSELRFQKMIEKSKK